MKKFTVLNKIRVGIFLCFAIATGVSNANLIDSTAWVTTGNVFTDDTINGFYFRVSSTGMFGGTPSASISQSISTTPGNSYEVQFFTTGFSLTHPFDTLGRFQFGSSIVNFAGSDDHHGGTSTFDSIFVATGEQTLIAVSFDANPALGFLQASVQGPFYGAAMNVLEVPDASSTVGLLIMSLTAMIFAKRFTRLKSCASGLVNSRC